MKTSIKHTFGFIILVIGVLNSSFSNNDAILCPSETVSPRIETFRFSSNGINTKGKIYLPAVYVTNKNLPAIFKYLDRDTWGTSIHSLLPESPFLFLRLV